MLFLIKITFIVSTFFFVSSENVQKVDYDVSSYLKQNFVSEEIIDSLFVDNTGDLVPRPVETLTAPIYNFANEKEIIKNEYIIVVDKTANVNSVIKTLDVNQKVLLVFQTRILKGFSAKLTNKGLEKLMKHPSVRFVEKDQLYPLTTAFLIYHLPSYIQDNIQDQIPKNLAIFLLDTGIAKIPGLQNRLAEGVSVVENEPNVTDTNGHGTCVASLAVEKFPNTTKIIPIKVTDSNGSGKKSWLVSAFVWILNFLDNHKLDKVKALVNVPFSVKRSVSLNLATNMLFARNVSVIAAGYNGKNENEVENFSPASAYGMFRLNIDEKLLNDILDYDNVTSPYLSQISQFVELQRKIDTNEDMRSMLDECKV